MKYIFLLAALCCLSGGSAGNPSPGIIAGSAARQEKRGRQFELQGQLKSNLGVHLTRVFSTVTLSNAYRPFRLKRLTDLSGYFKFKKVPEGTYILTVSIPRKGTLTRTIEMTPSFADSKNRIRITILVSAAGNRQPHQISVAELAVPKKARRVYEKAQNQLARGRTEAAVTHLKRALSLAPTYPTALNSLGTIFFQTGKYEEAREYFEKALEHDPAGYSPLVNLAGALASLGLFEEALEINLEAAQYRPLDPLVHAQLGHCYGALEQLDKALASLREAKRLEPGHFSHPQLTLGHIFLKKGLVKAAAREFREFLSLHPDSPSTPTIQKFLAGADRSNQD